MSIEDTSTWRSVPALLERLNAGASTPTFTASGIRYLLRNARQNGLDAHVRRIGKRLLLDEAGFRRWLAERPSTWRPGDAA